MASMHPPLPSFLELRADDAWHCVEFISDLHLSEAQPRTVSAWASYLQHSQADAIYILGDLFEVWIGDDACQPGRFEHRACEILTQAARRRPMGFMAGNRDFLVGPRMLQSCGIAALPDPTLLEAWGRRVLLSHGDSLCLADTAYQAFRQQVRSDAWQAEFLGQPLATRERVARQMRDASEARRHPTSVGDWADVDAGAALDWMRATRSADLVHGHTHRPGSEVLAPGMARHVLSDWDCDAEPGRAQLLRLTRDGFTRVDLAP